MLQVITANFTFPNTSAKLLSALTGAPERCSRIVVEPDPGNTHVCYVGDASLAPGTSTVNHVIKQLAKPSAADAVLDRFEMDVTEGSNQISTAQLAIAGTTNEKVRVTFFVG